MTPAQVIRIDVPAPGVRAAFSTREGGVSTGGHASLNVGSSSGDAEDAVRQNRGRLAEALGFDPVRAVTLRQVHGAMVVQVGGAGGRGAYAGSLEGHADADAAATSCPGVALLVLGADCPGVLMWARDGSAVAAAHAGWRGLVAGVVEAAVGALGVPAHATGAVIGPAVGACCYPVGSDVRAAMSARFGAGVLRGDAVDLQEACAGALVASGVPRGAIGRVRACTSCDEQRFFSYRRDGAHTGRHAGVVWIEEAA